MAVHFNFKEKLLSGKINKCDALAWATFDEFSLTLN